MRYFLFIPLLLIFSACSLQKQDSFKEIEEQISSDEKFYISSGRGESEKEAIAIALERIASAISSDVSSVFDMRKQSIDLDYTKKIEHDIKIEVKKINFSYSIVSSFKRDKKSYVKIKIDRKKSALFYANKLKRTLRQIEDELKHLSSLKKYLFLKKYPFHKLYYKLDTIKVLDQNYRGIGSFEQRIKALERKKYSYREKLSFTVISSNSQVQDIVIDMLSDAKFNISSNGDIKLMVNLGKIKIDEIYGEYYGTSNLTIKIVKKQEIITKVILLKAEPSFNKKGVNENIIEALKKKFSIFLEKEFR